MSFSKKTQVETQSKGLDEIRPPHLLILDSEGYLHDFCYSDTQSSESIQQNSTSLLSMSEFLRREHFLRRMLNRIKKPRGKSQTRKTLNVQEKKRTKSQVRMEDWSPFETLVS